ncbi:MAG: 5-(carboxyamino)imidazole ribonucleotide mutase [Syntrophobacterales bacterium]|jgi:5-(carboxyamino)imidazole ribonucleotide mutase|nr:5-(carboxyamino)imidazole ribonucleotide mutase [Syntrophobacterales bacterium]
MTIPKVLILIGSESDLSVVEEAAKLLKEVGVDVKLDISSAHRNPEKTVDYAKNARSDGFEVIIAAAGLAAHLPGVVASHTTLPVIGIPMAGGALNGVDAVLSILQMPKGVPVATVGINAARNAAILASEILSIKYEAVRHNLEKLRVAMRKESDEKSAQLRNYLKD